MMGKMRPSPHERVGRKTIRLALVGAAVLQILAASATAGTTTYKYDDLGRLYIVTRSTSSYSVYTYDTADNRTKLRVGSNSAPTCPSFTMTINQPNSNPVVVNVPIGQGCSDADGDTVQIVTPTTPYTVTIYPNTSIPVAYQVTDGIATASATITVCRGACP